MIRLGVISDSHGGAVRLEMFAQLAKNENFDAIVHLGDGQSDVKWLKKESANADLFRLWQLRLVWRRAARAAAGV